MDETRELASRFEAQRDRLRAVAYRMLGSVSEADDAVQEAWLRLQRTDATEVNNLAGWLTTVVGRVCLDLLRSRVARREDLIGTQLPDPIVRPADAQAPGPEYEALLADSVGVALLIVLDTLEPAERLAFVLHDMFALPFDEIAAILDRSPAATRQLASRARRRIKGSAPTPDADQSRQHAVVDAFFAAAREGDFAALVAVLDPDVVLRAEATRMPEGTARLVRGAEKVAGQALLFSRMGAGVFEPRALVVNGEPALAGLRNGEVQVLMGFTITGGKVSEIHIYAERARLAALQVT